MEETRCTEPSDLLLDIGTGGGEAALSVAHAALLLVGIDLSHGMIETARRNLVNTGSDSNVRFMHMNAEKLTFQDQFFNVVSSRHSDFCATEVFRVLGDGGIFLTQQVSENDKCNVSAAFGRGQTSDVQPGTLMERYKRDSARFMLTARK
ncbi:class I SAM-dependent methyltransferase [Paenibacillus xylanivorans]|uniref:class I SAM-dependent methyltransferase n=1 Tax=Paenibacillus xylanivorans TaxID=1705561 RepID=UPI0009E90125